MLYFLGNFQSLDDVTLSISLMEAFLLVVKKKKNHLQGDSDHGFLSLDLMILMDLFQLMILYDSMIEIILDMKVKLLVSQVYLRILLLFNVQICESTFSSSQTIRWKYIFFNALSVSVSNFALWRMKYIFSLLALTDSPGNRWEK